jgi:pSer/pThr/pTyr-binding forkhead associated (FHA) protein
MPPNPKRRTSRRGEPPYDEGDILRADDPRPQRVPQYPSATVGRRRKNEEQIPTSVYDTDAQDEELKASYDGKGMDAGGKPAFLYVEKGPGAGQLVPVRQGVLVIGRASVSDLRLQHPSISRRHSQLTRRGERFFFKDLGSQNGTFVNKEKIAHEVELQPGDSIGMGNALLKLRGPLAKDETVGQNSRLRPHARQVPTAVVMRPKSSGVVKVAMFAGAVGFGLCAVLAFALFRSPAKNAKPEGTAKTGKVIAIPAEVAQPKKQRFQAEPQADEIAIEAGPVNVTREKRIDDAIEKKMAEARANQPQPKPTEPAKVAEPAPTAAPSKTASAAAPAKAAQAKEEPAPKAAVPAAKGALLASYEKGDAEASLEAAKEAGDKALAGQLGKFLSAYQGGEEAFDRNDAKGAISKYEEALALDQKISGGFGKYGKEIRTRLSTIWLAAGNQFAKSGQNDGARNALKEALKHDPSNSKAKTLLASLEKEAKSSESTDEEAEAKPVAKKAAAKKTSADEAFDEEDEAPKKKPAARPAAKSSRAAIDDAFDD